jgi:hypothetical protein
MGFILNDEFYLSDILEKPIESVKKVYLPCGVNSSDKTNKKQQLKKQPQHPKDELLPFYLNKNLA